MRGYLSSNLGIHLRSCLFCILIFWRPPLLVADLPAIEQVKSPAVQLGASARLLIVGSNLKTVREIVFYEPGIACQTIDVVSDEELAVVLQAAVDCQTGMHAFRLRNDDGFSELRTLSVAPFPVLAGSVEDAALSMPCSVVAKLNSERPNRFEVSLTAGQRLSVDVEAIRLGIDMIDAALVIRDPNGKPLVQADDSNLYRQDPIASIVAPTTGKYTVEVQDAGRNAGEHAYFLLHISDGPRPTAVYPLGGQPNQTLELSFTGDCRGTWTAYQKLSDQKSPHSRFQLFAEQEGKYAATALPFRLSSLPNTNETESNDDFPNLDNASPIEAGSAINGRIQQPLDRDCFWMRGIAGEILEVQVFAQRLGSAADVLLTLVDSAQQTIARSDDVDSLDSRVEVTVPNDGVFGVIVEEKRGKGGEGFGYRVEVVPARPTAEVFLPRRDRLSQDMQTVSVPQGNRVLALMAVRKDDADGDATLRIPGLPENITAKFSQPRADQAIVPVVFEANPKAELLGKLVPLEVSVHSTNASAVGQFHQVTDLVRGPADAIYTEHNSDRLALSTRPSYPIRINVAQPKAALARGGSLDVIVNVERLPGCHDDVVLTVPWLPAWIDTDPRYVVPADQSQVAIRLRAWDDAEIADWPFVVEGAVSAPSRARRTRRSSSAPSAATFDSPPPATLYPQSVSSQLVELSVRDRPAVGRFALAAAEQGDTVVVHCELAKTDRLKDVTDLTATLEGLPNRVECDPVPVPSDSQSIAFQVRLQATAPIGRISGLNCRLSGKLMGERVSYIIARDGAITIAKPGQLTRDERGQPLSRLEALKKRSQSTAASATTNND